MMPTEDDQYTGVLGALRDLHVTWQEYEKRITAEILEYKKTVNNAISLLATEAIKFQADTKERLGADATERTARQLFVDHEAERRDDADKQRRKDASAEHAAFQKRAGRERAGIMSLLGCLILVNALALLALAVVLIAMYWWKPL